MGIAIHSGESALLIDLDLLQCGDLSLGHDSDSTGTTDDSVKITSRLLPHGQTLTNFVHRVQQKFTEYDGQNPHRFGGVVGVVSLKQG